MVVSSFELQTEDGRSQEEREGAVVLVIKTTFMPSICAAS